MKKFLAVVVGVVALGLAIRFTINKPKKAKPKAPGVETVEMTRPSQTEPTPTPRQPDPIPEPTPEPPKPEPPRIAGSVLVSDAQTSSYAAAKGVIYHCDEGSVIATPKEVGGQPKRVGECNSAFDFVADADAVFYCDHNSLGEEEGAHLMRITAGTEGSHVVAEVDCIMSTLDSKYAYFVVPGFEGMKDPGVYRVAREGGKPERIHTTRPKEQFMLAVDDEALWIGAWSAGTISKLAKTPGAKAKTVVTGQKGIVDLAIDGTYMYWYSEQTTEVRRRKKSGGKIEVVGHDIEQEPVIVVDGHAYWFEKPAGQDTRLMHMAPGAEKAEQLASGLRTPAMRADSEGVYVSELDREGIFMFKR